MPCANNIDWAATGTMLQGIGTVVGGFAVIGAAIIGSRTFDVWKRQKLAERHIEQAERILTAVYKVRRALSFVRSPMMWAHELDAAEESLKASGDWEKVFDAEEQRRWRTTQAYYNRLTKTADDRTALEQCQPMARALFGEELEKSIEKLNHQFWTIKIYVDANQSDRNGLDYEFRKKIDRAIFEGYPPKEENEIDCIIAQEVKSIESICLPVFRTVESANNLLKWLRTS